MIPHEDSLRLDLRLPVIFRKARHTDLEKLEWYGQFTHFRNIFLRSYKEQLTGHRLLLLACLNNFPIGRLFIQFKSNNAAISDGSSRAYLYSFHVMEIFRGQGIGTRSVYIAEKVLIRKGYSCATMAVAKENVRALNLYQRLGYHIFGENEGKWQYHDHTGNLKMIVEPCWLLEKQLPQNDRSTLKNNTNL